MNPLSDTQSVVSTASTQSLLDIMNDESARRRKKLRSKQISTPDSQRDHRHIHPGGIMVVRTLTESLASVGIAGRTNKYKVKRRMLKRALKGGTSTEESSRKSDTSTTSSNSDDSHRVNFDKIHIRDYPRIPGVNPSVMKGPPVTMDWIHVDEHCYDLELYEEARGVNRHRIMLEMRLEASDRQNLLRQLGFSWQEIQESIKAANIGRRKRRKTLLNIHHQKRDENLEKVVRAFKKSFSISHRSKLKKEALQNSASFDDKKSSKKQKGKQVGFNTKQVHDLNISRSHSAAEYDLTLEVDFDEEESDEDDSMMDDFDSASVDSDDKKSL